MSMDVNSNTTFTQIKSSYGTGSMTPGFESAKPLRLKDTTTGLFNKVTVQQLYTHSNFKAHGSSSDNVSARYEKYANAAQAIKQAIDKEYGQGMGEIVFGRLDKASTDRMSFDEIVLRKDLNVIQSEIDKVQQLQSLGKSAVGNPEKLALALQNTDFRQEFTTHITREISKENLEFFELARGMEQYDLGPTEDDSDPPDLANARNDMETLINTYVSNEGSKSINVDYESRGIVMYMVNAFGGDVQQMTADQITQLKEQILHKAEGGNYDGVMQGIVENLNDSLTRFRSKVNSE